jgi:hypothetical protein
LALHIQIAAIVNLRQNIALFPLDFGFEQSVYRTAIMKELMLSGAALRKKSD